MINLFTIPKHLRLRPLSRRDRRVVGTTLLLLGLAGLAVYLFASQMSDEKGVLIGEQVEVMKAARAIPAGTRLTPDMVKMELAPEKFLPPNPIFKTDVAHYYGKPVAVKIEKDAMVLASDFTTAEVVTELHQKLPEGDRAMMIRVEGGLVRDGLVHADDHVDLIGTLPYSAWARSRDTRGRVPKEDVVVRLLQNVTVLHVIQPPPHARRDKHQQVVVAVTDEEAMMLANVQEVGTLTLLLRNRDDIKVTLGGWRDLRRTFEELVIIQSGREERGRPRRHGCFPKHRSRRRVDIVIGSP